MPRDIILGIEKFDLIEAGRPVAPFTYGVGIPLGLGVGMTQDTSWVITQPD